MSCWRNFKCDVLKDVDDNNIREALKKMGLGFDEEQKQLRGESVDGVLTKEGRKISVGLQLHDSTGHAHVVGDFWLTGLNEKNFVDELSRSYQRINLEAQLELMGYTMDESAEEVREDGSVYLEAYCS